MINESIKQKICQILTSRIKEEVRIFSSKPLSGGDINSAAKLETSAGDYFVKWNNAKAYPQMFEKEAKGLELLSSTKTLRIPKVEFADEASGQSFLLLEFLNSSNYETNFWEHFGRGLAQMHKLTSDYFGLGHDNYIGSLPQSNKNHDNWIDFFVEERLGFQLRMARDSQLIDSSILSAAERLFNRLNEIVPNEPSSLVHGDLWSGNFMVGDQGEACLIDPAVYYGHREMDIAMSRLFGGFSAAFYESYNSEWPMQKGWENRIEIHNLYPLLVHVNLFGGGYVSQVASILKRF